MARSDASLPEFARTLLGESDKDRTSVLEAVHPDYAANSETWVTLLDAFEGAGGFLSGEYIWRYKNEIASDYDSRKAMARYHNYVETIIDLYVRHVFSKAPERTTTNPDLEAFWLDVDGAGTGIDDYMRRQCALALAAGHTAVLMDATSDEPTGPSKADQKARPFLVSYTAPSIPDWRMNRNELVAVKLLEDVPATDIAALLPEGDEAKQYLLWDTEGWARFDHEGQLMDGDMPGLGLVPLAVLRPKPSILKPFMGRPLFGNANIVKALFNRMSEEDEVLRGQAFSLLTVEAGEGVDVSAVRDQIGKEFGVSRAVIAQGHIKYESPDMEIPKTIREHIDGIVREIYRIAHMRFQRDSLDAESAEAIRLQNAELNEMLQGLAAALTECERQIARFYFAWTSATPDEAESAFESADVSIAYAREFFLEDLAEDLKAWADAIRLSLGDTFEKRIKKRIVKRIEPDIPPDELAEVEAEIDALPSAADLEQAQRDQVAAQTRARFGGAA